MGVYINMKMPSNEPMLVKINPDGSVSTTAKNGYKKCEAISISEPHGRLIDADALNYTMLYKENWMRGTGIEAPAVWRKDIDAAPTIIPASKEE